MPRRKTSDKQFADLTQEIDIEKLRKSIKADFLDFPDPRRGGNLRYPAWYLLLVILSGYLSGGNTIEDIADFADLRKTWFSDITGLDVGVPSYDTIWWFLVRTDPIAFKELLSKWLQGLPEDLRNQLLVIDGKRLRGVSDNEHITHIVELFAADTCLTIAQEKVPDKAGERSALPILLDAIDVKGTIVSMDALYAHITDMQEVLDRGADYIVGIKGNQGNLEAEIRNYFTQAYEADYEGVEVSQVENEEKGHGRTEKRKVTVTNDLDWLPQKDAWGLQSLIEVRSKRTLNNTVEQAIRYYGSSRKSGAQKFSTWIREHWSIENRLHYIVDVVFDEDASLSDCGNSAENMSLIRRLTMNIIRTFDPKRSIAVARRCATHEPKYLRGLLGKVFC
jgi:predicted transposase YbfD/YdcC|tara:strand:- start:25 stop:1200 length:1176 start_codon:yes stop_codon:yes gene_type:complete